MSSINITPLKKIEASINKLQIDIFWAKIKNKRLYAHEVADYHNTTIQTFYTCFKKIKNVSKINSILILEIAYSIQVLADKEVLNPLQIKSTLKDAYL